ncbi:uncharacterized protein LOC143378576 isoform X1 [Andrena cerasifolii]
MKFRRNDRVSYGYVSTFLTVYYTLFQNVNDYSLNVLDTLSSMNPTIKVRKLRYFTNFFLLPLITISSLRHGSKVKRVFENIDRFDKEVKYLNTEIDHVACMRNDVVQIATATFVVVLLNFMDYYALLDSDRTYMYIIMWILDRVPDFVNTVTICSFASLINKIRFRFEAINSIEHIITNGKTLDSLTEPSDINNVYRLKLIKLLQLKLCKTVSLVNEAYGFQFMILSILYIVYVCLHMCIVYVENQDYIIDIVLSFLWGIMDAVKFAYIIHVYRTQTMQ